MRLLIVFVFVLFFPIGFDDEDEDKERFDCVRRVDERTSNCCVQERTVNAMII